MTKLNLIKPKYSGCFCGESEYRYVADTIYYLWFRLMENNHRTHAILLDDLTTIKVRPNRNKLIGLICKTRPEPK
jgi:hypothetical protein